MEQLLWIVGSGLLMSAIVLVGIEATGDRICYVIDLSDSMLEPMTPRGPPGISVLGVARLCFRFLLG